MSGVGEEDLLDLEELVDLAYDGRDEREDDVIVVVVGMGGDEDDMDDMGGL